MKPNHAPYDPVKAREYYLRTRKLKGRKKNGALTATGPTKTPKKKFVSKGKAEIKARIGRLRSHISKLEGALSAIEAELSAKRGKNREKAKDDSDGKSSTQEKKASQEYKDKHQAEVKAKSKSDNSSSSSSKSSSSSSSKSSSDSDVEALEARASKIRGLIKEARRQLSNANQQLGSLAHSALLSDPNIEERFVQSQSAERIPSK